MRPLFPELKSYLDPIKRMLEPETTSLAYFLRVADAQLVTACTAGHAFQPPGRALRFIGADRPLTTRPANQTRATGLPGVMGGGI